MNAFDYLAPKTLQEALALLSEHGEDAKLIAGGTALLTMMKQRLLMPEILISVGDIAECREAAVVVGNMRLGGFMNHQQVMSHPLVAEHFPVLIETLKEVSSPRIRNMATLGGALAHADPNQDTLVTLLALQAKAVVQTRERTRTLPLTEFFVDYYETQLAPEEIITAIEIPLPPANTTSAYQKFLPRSLEDYGVVSVAATVTGNEEHCEACQIALGCVGDVPVRATEAEALLVGQSLSDENIAQAADVAKAVTAPVSDSRGSSAYKKKMAGVFVKRVLTEARSRLNGGA